MQIERCDLSGAVLERVRLSCSIFQLVFLDGAVLTDCNFSGAKIRSALFADSRIEGCTFTDCDLVLCNLMGVRCGGTVFDHSNLYGSRFIGARFEKVSMRDCNLTRTFFTRGQEADIDFRSSNTNEAIFVGMKSRDNAQ